MGDDPHPGHGREFFNVLAPDQARQILLKRLTPRVVIEPVPTSEGLGRVTAEPVYAPEDLPSFPRSTVDGFSLRAADTFGASEGLPAYFAVVGEVPMGQGAAMQSGSADVGLGILSAARALDLEFVPLLNEQYDLVIPQVHYESDLLRPLLDLLQDTDFRRDVAALGGYDVASMGQVVEELG